MDGFIGETDTPLEQEFLYISVAQAKPKVELDSMADDFCWKTVTVVEITRVVHAFSISRDEHLVNVTVPL